MFLVMLIYFFLLIDRFVIGCRSRELLLDWTWASWPATKTSTATSSVPATTTTVQKQRMTWGRRRSTCLRLGFFSLQFHWLSRFWRRCAAKLWKFSRGCWYDWFLYCYRVHISFISARRLERVFANSVLSVRLSVCLSVRPSDTLVSHVQTVQDIKTRFAPHDRATLIVSWVKFRCSEFRGSPRTSVLKTGTPCRKRKIDHNLQ